MANKMPYLQFYPADWTADTRILSLAARAAWLEIILAMHTRGQADSVTGTPARLAGLVGCSEAEFMLILDELRDNGICDIVTACNGNVTLTCRRLKNANSERKKTAERVRKFRCNAAVTGHTRAVPYPEPDKENIPVGDIKESTPAEDEKEDPFPHSVDEVLEMAKEIYCGQPCSREQADAYFTDRVSKDWTPYGQQRMKTRVQICMDLKKWLMRDQNNQNKTNGKQNVNNGKRDVRVIENDPTKFDAADDGRNF